MDAKRFEVTRSDEEWRRLLTPEQYAVMRGHGTERPGSCATPVLGLRRSAARTTTASVPSCSEPSRCGLETLMLAALPQ